MFITKPSILIFGLATFTFTLASANPIDPGLVKKDAIPEPMTKHAGYPNYGCVSSSSCDHVHGSKRLLHSARLRWREILITLIRLILDPKGRSSRSTWTSSPKLLSLLLWSTPVDSSELVNDHDHHHPKTKLSLIPTNVIEAYAQWFLTNPSCSCRYFPCSPLWNDDDQTQTQEW